MRRLAILWCLLGALVYGEPLEVSWTPQEGILAVPVRTRDGEPVFLREVYSLKREEDYAVARRLGFNAVIEQGPAVFRQAAAAGFLVTEASWYTTHSEDREALAEAEAFRGEPGLVAYNLNDEPDLRPHISPPAALAQAAGLLRRNDPHARTSVTLAGWGRARDAWPAYAAAVDILRVDPYPLIMRQPLRHVSELVTAARQAGPSKPVVAVLQAWTWPGGPFPTAAQTRCMVYQALIAGAGGISYFDWNDAEWARHPEWVTEVARLNRMLGEEWEPFLLRGRRWTATDRDDLAAGLWTLDSGDWLVLATRLGDDAEPMTARFRLPPGVSMPATPEVFGGAVTVGPDGTMEVELPPLGTVAIATPGPRIGPIVPQPATGWYATDWAGRPWQRVDDPAPWQPCAVEDDGSTPWMRAGLQARVTGPLPVEDGLNPAGRVFRVCPGGRFEHALALDPGRAELLAVRIESWQDNRGELTGEELSRLVSLTAAAEPHQWAVSVHLPADRDYDASRDHLLTVAIDYRHEGHPHRDRRVVRFRVEGPAAIGWKWETATTGEVSYRPTFDDRFYQVRPDEWQLEVRGEGLLVTPLSRGARTATVAIAPAPDAPDGLLLHLTASLRAGDVELAGAGLESVYATDGVLQTATARKGIEARRLEAFDFGAPWERLWATTDRLVPCRHFLYQGSRSFVEGAYQAWFGWDEAQLYWFMQIPFKWYVPAAETTETDSNFLGDDVAFLAIQTTEAPAPTAFMIQLNSRGTAWHAQVAPQFDPGWTPELRSRHDTRDQTWRLAVAVRWRDLGLDGPPTAPRANVGTAQSIAPRVRTTWHYWGQPFDPRESLAPMAFRAE